jgi:hypothetical protein
MLNHNDPGTGVQVLEHPDTLPELPSERRLSSNEADRALAPSRLPPELDVSPYFAKGHTEQRHGFVRRHPLVAAVGLPLILAAGASGYTYWDHASHFETTEMPSSRHATFRSLPRWPVTSRWYRLPTTSTSLPAW